MAKKLGMQVPGVKSRLHRARELVREYLVGPVPEDHTSSCSTDSLIQSTGEMYEVELFTLCNCRSDCRDAGATGRDRERASNRSNSKQRGIP